MASLRLTFLTTRLPQHLLTWVAIGWFLGLLPTPPLMAAPSRQADAGCIELIVNGGFESGNAGWSPAADSYLFAYDNTWARSGTSALLLSSPEDSPMPARMSAVQTVAVSGNHLELSFYYVLHRAGQATSNHRAELVVLDMATNTPILTVDLAGSEEDEWVEARHDLSAAAGHTIRLAFNLHRGAETGQLTLRVDDVSLLGCGARVDLPGPAQAAPPETPSPPMAELVLREAMPNGLPDCDCNAPRYRCADFPTWSAAQACYSLCQVTAGYDIHGLDADENGIACELALPDLVGPATVVTILVAPTSTPAPEEEITGTATSQPVHGAAETPTPATEMPVSEADNAASPAATQAPSSTTPTDATLPLQILTMLVVFAAGILIVGGVIAVIVSRASG